MSATHHPSAQPMRVRYHSTDLATDVLTVKGYRGKCACGWVGPVRSHHSHARDDAKRHRREELDAEIAAPKREDVRATGRAEAS